MRIAKLNEKYKEYLKGRITGDKNRFGWYTAVLKNGAVAIGSNLKELEESIIARTK